MKGTAFLFIIFASGLLVAGACMASNPDTAGTSFKTQSRQERLRPDSRLLIAERTDMEDRITYGTDPEMERAMAEQERHEKEKEEKAWQMLQNMNIYKSSKKSQGSNQTDKTPQQ